MKLHLRMAERKINMKELAQATGIRPATISNYYYDNYKHVTKEHLEALCKYFNCSISDLIEYIPDEPK